MQSATHVQPDRERIEQWLVERVSVSLAVDAARIDLGETLATYGMTSVAAVTLTGELEAWLGLELAPTLAWEYPTIERLAEHLAGLLPEGGG